VDKAQLLLSLAVAMFAIGMVGVIIRRNVLVMLMCMELMLNGVNLSLVTFAHQSGTTVGAVLVFLIFVVATAEIAIAIPIVLMLVKRKQTLDPAAYTDLKG
jgi:NADH-quinone oxidoreductase subunit K